ncbi:putative nucleotide-binding alpha-beta plait domain-containing protein [Medicago truncatula]|uniref:Putative nucleotide-binding alpha-beta plait domain-containing protein n=2 Tax=Medicago truncatula TaxID=3880 RepID=G7KDR6_MEDTR|nr:RNA-binding protein CP31B, chloroplastic isoform X1 [Medicago truncatula]AES95833.1 RNA-binding (RRM/RBD/RNP motif) family protein [Medicago truncatula]RHN54826.1 putative nucleotide-binding alpha-beta plait domain-containing protein [Medicago truncatula]
MATLESTLTVFTHQRFSNNNNYRFLSKSPDSIKLHASTSIPSSSSFSLFSHNNHKLHFSSSSKSKTLCYALQEVTEASATTEEEEAKTETLNNVKKNLIVFNLPWSLSKPDIKDLFGQCGTVIDVEIIKSKDGKGKGYTFVTMDSGEGAQAAVDKFNATEISGRILRVEFAKGFKKPRPPPPAPTPKEARYVIYASNLAWKARSTHLRDIFTENFKTPVSARVVFQVPGGKSAGYGFVSYHTEEEAEAAISALQGKELLGRPLLVKISERKVKEAGSEEVEEKVDDVQPEAGSEEVEEKVDDVQPEAGSEEVEEKVDDAQPEES